MTLFLLKRGGEGMNPHLREKGVSHDTKRVDKAGALSAKQTAFILLASHLTGDRTQIAHIDTTLLR
jgi:hypothetical protein